MQSLHVSLVCFVLVLAGALRSRGCCRLQAMTELLLAHGAAVNAREAADLGAFTALHYAVKGGHVDVIETLLAGGADPSAPDTSLQFTPLHHAARLLHTEVAKVLLARGADPHARDVHGSNASFWADQYNHTAFLAIPGMPTPSSATVEEVAAATLLGQAAATKLPGMASLPSKVKKGKAGKKSGKKKGKRGK